MLSTRFFIRLIEGSSKITIAYYFRILNRFSSFKSWYSWGLQSLVNGVYAFGFLFMLPQLFVNYKLKSVAHLPWRAFMYKVGLKTSNLSLIFFYVDLIENIL